MKFHKELNPKLWDKITNEETGEEIYELKSEVKNKLLEIADAFIEYLEINEEAIKDVVITGSSASYNYTPHSDIDLHLKVNFEEVHENCPLVQNYLLVYKSKFNDARDISIYGVPVEVYAEALEEDTVHNGLYSLWQDKWIDIPRRIPPTENDEAVKAKYNEIKDAAEALEDGEEAEKLLDKIKKMRKAGLAEAGEFSTENLTFKKLRDNGVIKKLMDMKKEKIDKQLSLESYDKSIKSERKEAWELLVERTNTMKGRYFNLVRQMNEIMEKTDTEEEFELFVDIATPILTTNGIDYNVDMDEFSIDIRYKDIATSVIWQSEWVGSDKEMSCRLDKDTYLSEKYNPNLPLYIINKDIRTFMNRIVSRLRTND